MKRCPTCQRTFTDSNLSFCTDDGTPLTQVESGSPDNEWGAVAYKPPSYQAAADKPKRSALPWVLGIGIVVIVVIAGLGIAAAVFVPRMMREQEVRRAAENPPPPGLKPTPSGNVNASTPEAPAETIKTPPPTDKELVLSQLTQLEHDWTVANFNADKKKLELILADDYVGPATANVNGPTQGKDEYIRRIERDTSVEKWDFADLELTLRGERATLVGKVHFTIQGKVQTFSFTDKFVWRDGRWQATGSVVVRATDL